MSMARMSVFSVSTVVGMTIMMTSVIVASSRRILLLVTLDGMQESAASNVDSRDPRCCRQRTSISLHKTIHTSVEGLMVASPIPSSKLLGCWQLRMSLRCSELYVAHFEDSSRKHKATVGLESTGGKRAVAIP